MAMFVIAAQSGELTVFLEELCQKRPNKWTTHGRRALAFTTAQSAQETLEREFYPLRGDVEYSVLELELQPVITPKHSPTPWRVAITGKLRIVYDVYDRIVLALYEPEDSGNAEFLVAAVNAAAKPAVAQEKAL